MNLIYKIDRAYRVGGEMGEGGFNAEGGGRIGFLFSDAMERAARLFKDSDNRPLWIPSVRDGAPNMFAGWPYEVSGPMSTNGSPTTTDDIPALFGNFSYFAIRTVQSIEIFRFMDSRTMQNNLVECLAFSRRDAKVIGAVNGGSGRSQTTEAIGRLKVA